MTVVYPVIFGVPQIYKLPVFQAYYPIFCLSKERRFNDVGTDLHTPHYFWSSVRKYLDFEPQNSKARKTKMIGDYF